MENKTIKDKLSKKVIAESRGNFSKIYRQLGLVYPEARCALDYKTPFQLLVATILSAQCTDKRVNMVTPALFERYPDAGAMAKAKLEDLMRMIRSTGFYRNKSKNILAAAMIIMKEFGGKVPENMPGLLTLPGVARKTANVVLANAFGKNEGIAVDTHVGRVAGRLGLTDEENPVKIERDLMKFVPRNEWGRLSHLLIFLGRDVCKAPIPVCGKCRLQKLCPWYDRIIVNNKSQ